MKRGPSTKGKPKRSKQMGPQSDQEKKFCERWLIHFDKDRAFREAGYANTAGAGNRALSMLEKFADYLRPIREAKAKIIAERLAIDSDQVLQGMVKQVFFDPTSFYERSTEPLTESVKEKGHKEPMERVKMWHGKPIYAERLKPYSDLTPEQRAVVELTGELAGRIQYRLPTIREKHMYLTSLGRQFGMFSEKIIFERHNHKHTHHHVSFEGVPTQKLARLTQQMLPLVELEFAQSLGFTLDDVEAAAREDEGVVIPAAG